MAKGSGISIISTKSGLLHLRLVGTRPDGPQPRKPGRRGGESRGGSRYAGVGVGMLRGAGDSLI